MPIEFPAKLQGLFQPARYKVAWGGRGSGKSWGYARALLIQAASRPLRILCTREVQKSIRDSVHRLLSDQIQTLGLGAAFDVLDHEIRGRNGSLFVFAGLSDQTAESIKSYEGVDIVWVEEAHAVSKRSWDILIPTIRKEQSEIWISFNPDLETDETAQRFVLDPPAGSVVVKMNYSDNPWFPAVLEAERLHCEKRDPVGYLNIWEGQFRPAAEGAIYYQEMAQMEHEGRILDLPHDSTKPVHVVYDLGWNDSTAIILAQRGRADLRVIEYIEASHRKLSDYVRELAGKPYVWGKDWLPHDGFADDVKSQSAYAILKGLGRSVASRDEIVEESVEGGIRVVRETFPRVYIDRKCARLIECLKRYKRSVNRTTSEPGKPVHDEYSHGADCFRYLCLNAERLVTEPRKPVPLPKPRYTEHAWMS